ncbi:MAG: pyridoxal phosphate-dependent aminotransferase [Chromatiales bacterium]|jgi:aspartate aminotransferase|nr:pyridoxal phosphate-dependent aminotransferase [Chromatiales bacterium]
MTTENSASFQRSDRLDGIELSIIVRIQERAAQLRASGVDIIGLGTGEPDFDTPEHIKDAADAAMRAGKTKYPPTAGTPDLKAAVSEKFARENNFEYAANEIVISTGAKQTLFNAFMASINPGDEVVIPAPYWGVYKDIVRICGGVPKVLMAGFDTGFRIAPEALEEAIGPRTRWLMLNSPSNPSGAAYGPSELAGLLDVLERHPHVWLLSDDIYEHIVYDQDGYAHALTLRPQLRDRTLIVNGVSKAYAMTGWRIGYGAAPAELCEAMVAVQGHVTSGASSIGQAAAVAALNGPQDHIAVRREEFRRRRDMVVGMLNQAQGVECLTPEGAFYVFPSCAGTNGKVTPDGEHIESEFDFCKYLLDSVGVAVIPGSDFGVPDHFRISYAYAEESLREACTRIEQACGALK